MLALVQLATSQRAFTLHDDVIVDLDSHLHPAFCQGSGRRAPRRVGDGGQRLPVGLSLHGRARRNTRISLGFVALGHCRGGAGGERRREGAARQATEQQ
jgi:hypothetical protein